MPTIDSIQVGGPAIRGEPDRGILKDHGLAMRVARST
jgi:hypothetical protein